MDGEEQKWEDQWKESWKDPRRSFDETNGGKKGFVNKIKAEKQMQEFKKKQREAEKIYEICDDLNYGDEQRKSKILWGMVWKFVSAVLVLVLIAWLITK